MTDLICCLIRPGCEVRRDGRTYRAGQRILLPADVAANWVKGGLVTVLDDEGDDAA